MSKSARYDKVEVQKGAINMKDQETYRFMGRPEKTMKDIVEAQARRNYQTMDFHTPKH